jgi:2-polyprenyl-3-methyl-5-hydroxy-6-metoxy-1,4-benzoquinol methylase
MAGNVTNLEEQQARLSDVHTSDFRSANLWALMGAEVRPGTVLDVGCGAGGMVEWLLARGHDARGIDSNPNTIGAAKAFLASRGHDAERVSTQSLDELIVGDTRFDTVISMDCLEHIEDDRAAFNRLVQLLKPGGRLLITVPALPAVYGARDRAIGHYRRYTARSLAALAEGQPIKILKQRYWNMLGVAPTFVSQRILDRAIDESFRYGEITRSRRALRAALFQWFRQVENRIKPPLGLTAIMIAERS